MTSQPPAAPLRPGRGAAAAMALALAACLAPRAFGQGTADAAGAGPEERPRPQAAAPADDDFDSFDGEFGKGRGPARDVFDPLRGYNRLMFKANDKFYFWVAKPLARGYNFIAPQQARLAVNRAFLNFAFPIRFANCLLQLKMKKAGLELGRLAVNSTAGLGGLFDPADRWLGWRAPGEEDFGQTLGRYGVGEGFPLVLPILGPSSLRDGLGMAPNFFVNPVNYVAGFDVNFALAAGDRFNYISLHLGEYESLKKDALDPYAFFRDAFKQARDRKIRE